jgi:hypothetical protein
MSISQFNRWVTFLTFRQRHEAGISGFGTTDLTVAQVDVRFVPILLQKSVVTDGCWSAVSLTRTGFGAPAPTLSKQLLRYATQRMSGGRSRNQRCEPPQVLGDGSKDKLVLGTSRATQSKPTELQDAL